MTKFDQFVLRALAQTLKDQPAVSNMHMADELHVRIPGHDLRIRPATHEACFIFNKTKVPLFLMLKDRGPRFYRECYVEKTTIKWARSEGMMDLAHIFVEANGARWAVLRRADDQYVLADLWETTTDDSREHIHMGAHHVFPVRDAALAAAMLL